MANKWLTSLQSEFLTRFFATDTGQDFFLTGGTALAAFHLRHRVSVDLDLFTLDDLALREGEMLVPQLAADLKCHVARTRRTEHYCEFLLEPGEGQALKVDLMRDVGPQYDEHIKVGAVIVDSVENIGANKLTAILGRSKPKDFVDLYFPSGKVGLGHLAEVLSQANFVQLFLQSAQAAVLLSNIRDESLPSPVFAQALV